MERPIAAADHDAMTATSRGKRATLTECAEIEIHIRDFDTGFGEAPQAGCQVGGFDACQHSRARAPARAKHVRRAYCHMTLNRPPLLRRWRIRMRACLEDSGRTPNPQHSSAGRGKRVCRWSFTAANCRATSAGLDQKHRPHPIILDVGANGLSLRIAEEPHRAAATEC